MHHRARVHGINRFAVLALWVLVISLTTPLSWARETAAGNPAGGARPADERQTADDQRHPGLFAIRTYQRYVSDLLGPRCNFQPSCSRYAAEAIRRYGIVTGMILAAGRLTRCHYCAGLYYRQSHGFLVDPVDDHRLTADAR